MAHNWSLHAFDAWNVLVKQARKQKQITYGEFTASIGLENPRNANLALGPIQDYCLEANLPPLTSIVVSKSGGIGNGFFGYSDYREGQQKVYDFDWNKEENPFAFAASGEST